MTEVPPGALISDNGYYWWDEPNNKWQPTGKSGSRSSAPAIGQLSPGGHYKWDGHDWKPTTARREEHPGQSRATSERAREIDRGTREHTPSNDYSWFESDWAGREILARYLTGGGDWDIDQVDWAEYMRANEILRHTLDQHVRHIIAEAATRPAGEKISVAERFHAEMENGESIVGYQYLHGTSEKAGDFTIEGSAEHLPGHDGSPMRIQYNLIFTWNDIIHPNRQYGTDTFKNEIAKAISPGYAKSYRISIKWAGEGLVTTGQAGDIEEILPTSESGDHFNSYPLQQQPQ